MPFCNKCGKGIGNNDKFCSSCGAPQMLDSKNADKFNINTQENNSINAHNKKDNKSNWGLSIIIVFIILYTFCGVIADVGETNDKNIQIEEINKDFENNCPISVTNVYVYDDFMGYPKLKGTFTNLSDKNIIAMELYFVPKDVYGNERENWMSTNRLVTDNILCARKKDNRTWSFIDKQVKNGELYIYSVYFEDGTSWGDKDATKEVILKYGKKVEVAFEK